MKKKVSELTGQPKEQPVALDGVRNPKGLTGENRERGNGRPTEDDRAVKWTDQSTGHNSNT